MRQMYSFFLTCLSAFVIAQEMPYKDEIYLTHIKSVKFHIQGLATSMPIIDKGSPATLLLSFDDILGGDRNYIYRLIHCDKDWMPSSLLAEQEYITGFNEEEINDYHYSLNTKLDYTHYQLTLPNNDVQWILSGNYALEVWDDDSDELAFTRRFAVVEPSVKITGQVQRPLSVKEINSHHLLQFVINYENFTIRNPQRELFVTAIKNSQWGLSLDNILPTAVFANQISYDLQAGIKFPAGREYRGVDLRAMRSRGFGVYGLEVNSNEIKVTVALDKDRKGSVYQQFNDLNGDYVIESIEFNDVDVRGEYMSCYFTLAPEQRVLDGEVYLMGEFSDWQAKEEYRMEYLPNEGVYHVKAILKQGYYDYAYGVRRDDGSLDLSYFEGNHFAARNEYLVLCYFREFGSRYDRLISAYLMNSN